MLRSSSMVTLSCGGSALVRLDRRKQMDWRVEQALDGDGDSRHDHAQEEREAESAEENHERGLGVPFRGDRGIYLAVDWPCDLGLLPDSRPDVLDEDGEHAVEHKAQRCCAPARVFIL